MYLAFIIQFLYPRGVFISTVVVLIFVKKKKDKKQTVF